MGKYNNCFLSCVCPCCFGQIRYLMVAMAFFSIIVTHCQRAVLSIAIVEMVGSKNQTTKSTCPNPGGAPSVIANIGGGKVDWNEREQNLNLASFYIGYFIMHIPFGILCDRYGARHVLIWGIVLSTITTGLTPIVTVTLPWWSVTILRVLCGVGQSTQYPALSSLFSRWVPYHERGTSSALIFASNAVGYVVATLCSGIMINYFENWPIAFYAWTILGVFYVLLAFLYLFSDPRTHPFLHEVELQYLQEMIVLTERHKIPAKAICTDICVIGLVIGQIGHDLIMFTFANNLPKYLNNVLGLDIKTNSMFAFIYLGQIISALTFGAISDCLILRNLRVDLARWVLTDLSLLVPGVSMLGLGYVKCNIQWASVFLVISMFFNGLYFCALKVHVIEISNNHTGLMMAIVNGTGAVSGFVGSMIIGVIAKDNTHEQWILVFYIMLGMHIACGTGYTLMSKTDRRKWDYQDGEEIKPVRRSKKCYLQLSPSAHELRKQEIQKANETHQANVLAAKQKMKEAMNK